MRKISHRHKKWFLSRIRYSKRLKNRRQDRRHVRGRAIFAKNEFSRIRAKLPEPDFDFTGKPKYAAFNPPKELSFENNYRDTLTFILDFQRLFYQKRFMTCPDGSVRPVYANFGKIEKIDAGAGLVLAAEIHRWAQILKKRPRVDDHLWTENVRNFFLEAGLFELLGIDPQNINIREPNDTIRQTVRFETGRSSRGANAEKLRTAIESLASKSIGPRPTVYAAICEAISNVRHAYPDEYVGWPGRSRHRWWASGFWSESEGKIGIQLYDHGAGIPATLPNQPHWNRILTKILPSIDVSGKDSARIAAALEYGRTSTNLPGRGKGLAEMAEWIRKTDDGFLRILSGSGQITYQSGGKVIRKDLNAPFCGTLVEWEVKIG